MNLFRSGKTWLIKLLISPLFCIGLTINTFAQKVKRKKHSHHSLIKSGHFNGMASFYDSKFNGRRTASGEILNQNKLTAACNKFPFGTWLKVTNMHNKKWAIVLVNDRLPLRTRRIVDVTTIGATKLGFKSQGICKVSVQLVSH